MVGTTEMSGKVCLVTGASSGIGLITARELARMGARVILVARDKAKGEAALAEVKKVSGSQSVDLLLADLSSQKSIRALAEEVLARYPKLHVLVNNAGAANDKRSVTVDGIETTLATNHLAYFLLTNLLLGRLKESAPARIVSVSSGGQAMGHIDFEDLQGEEKYSPFKAYNQSKLANVLFTYELSRRLEGTGVTANCLHPGVINTNFGAGTTGLFNLMVIFARPFMLTPEKGAETQIYLASSPEVEGVSGKYFDKKKPRKSSKESYDLEVARRLWEVSEKLTS
jgi:retinol dehydrogenase 14